MILEGRTISKGRAEGKALKLEQPLSFLGGVEGSTGDLKVEKEGNVAGRILVFPTGKGSTVGSFVMYDLMVHGKAPAAVVNTSAETIVVTGAVISSIPMVDGIDVSLIHDGDDVTVDADRGSVEIANVTVTECASSVVMIDGKFIMLHRPDGARLYPGCWSLVAGKREKEESIEETAVREIFEETGIKVGSSAATMEDLLVREGDRIWKVRLFLFVAESGSVPAINSENTEYRMCTLDNLKEMKLVPNTVKAVETMFGRL